MSIFSVTDDIVSGQVERTVVDEHSEFQKLWVPYCIPFPWNKKFVFNRGILSNHTFGGTCDIDADHLPDKFIPGLREIDFANMRIALNFDDQPSTQLIGNSEGGWNKISGDTIYLSNIELIQDFKIRSHNEIVFDNVKRCYNVQFNCNGMVFKNSRPEFVDCTNTYSTHLTIHLDSEKVVQQYYPDYKPYFDVMRKDLAECISRVTETTPDIIWINRKHPEFCQLLKFGSIIPSRIRIYVQGMDIRIEPMSSAVVQAILKAMDLKDNDANVFCNKYIVSIKPIDDKDSTYIKTL